MRLSHWKVTGRGNYVTFCLFYFHWWNEFQWNVQTSNKTTKGFKRDVSHLLQMNYYRFADLLREKLLISPSASYVFHSLLISICVNMNMVSLLALSL